ncbi:MAG: NAD+ synthase, partial [Desulfobulbaceae bacterium]|nr:NAD+ synthase [Desulfobulbaceae bacterium]
MKIALIQINPVIGDFTRNAALITARLAEAKEAGCELAILPELAISGYPPQDLLERTAFLVDHQRAIDELVATTHGIGVICGAFTPHQDRATGKPLHNSAILFSDGEILFAAHKRLLPTYDVFDESRYFESARKGETFSFRGLRLGITICEDIWNDKDIFKRQLYDCDPVADLVSDPAGSPDLLINIAASPFQIGKEEIRRQIFTTLCRKHKIPFCYVNQVGGQDSLLFDGNSLALDANGNELGHGLAFAEDMVIIDTVAVPGQSKPVANETAALFAALTKGTRD